MSRDQQTAPGLNRFALAARPDIREGQGARKSFTGLKLMIRRQNWCVFLTTRPIQQMQRGSKPRGQYSRAPTIKYSATSSSMTSSA
eukprot:295877-Rhodomonas_salina.3